jgi:hypothetical protein
VVGRVVPLILRSPTLHSPNLRSPSLRSPSVSKKPESIASLLGFKGFSPAVLPTSRQLHATARRESHPDVYRRACCLLSGRPPPINLSFNGFSRKSGWFAEDACGSRRGVCVTGLAKFPERDGALNANDGFRVLAALPN